MSLFLKKQLCFNLTILAVQKDEYLAQMRTAYHELFDGLSPDEQHDHAARLKVLEPVLEWYRERCTVALDNRKADGRVQAVLSKTVEPFIHQVSFHPL